MFAEIITIGDELLIGQVVDTNSAWIGQKLNKIGWMTCVIPQTDRSAVLRVEVLYFQHLSIGGLDEVKFIF